MRLASEAEHDQVAINVKAAEGSNVAAQLTALHSDDFPTAVISAREALRVAPSEYERNEVFEATLLSYLVMSPAQTVSIGHVVDDAWFSPGGRFLVETSMAGVTVWDLVERRADESMSVQGFIENVYFDSPETRVAILVPGSATSQATIRSWPLREPGRLTRLVVDQPVVNVEVAGPGELVVCGKGDQDHVGVYHNLDSGKSRELTVKRFPGETEHEYFHIEQSRLIFNQLALEPGDESASATGVTKLVFRDIRTGDRTREIDVAPIGLARWVGKDHWVVTVSARTSGLRRFAAVDGRTGLELGHTNFHCDSVRGVRVNRMRVSVVCESGKVRTIESASIDGRGAITRNALSSDVLEEGRTWGRSEGHGEVDLKEDGDFQVYGSKGSGSWPRRAAGDVVAAEVSSEDEFLVTLDRSGVLRWWPIDHKPRECVEQKWFDSSYSYFDALRSVVVGSSSKRVRVIPVDPVGPPEEYALPGSAEDCDSTTVNADGTRIAVRCDERTLAVKRGALPWWTFRSEGVIAPGTIRITEEGVVLFGVEHDQGVLSLYEVVDSGTPSQRCTFSLVGHPVGFTGDGARFIVAQPDGTPEFRDATTCSSQDFAFGEGIPQAIRPEDHAEGSLQLGWGDLPALYSEVGLEPKARWYVSESRQVGALRVWDTRTGLPMSAKSNGGFTGFSPSAFAVKRSGKGYYEVGPGVEGAALDCQVGLDVRTNLNWLKAVAIVATGVDTDRESYTRLLTFSDSAKFSSSVCVSISGRLEERLRDRLAAIGYCPR